MKIEIGRLKRLAATAIPEQFKFRGERKHRTNDTGNNFQDKKVSLFKTF